MSNSWAKGSSNNLSWGAAASGKPKSTKGRYVPPPATGGGAAGSAARAAAPAGGGKMKYVPPPTNAGAWNRPKATGQGPCQWKELADKEDAQLKASKKVMRAEAKQNNSVGMSGNDKADIAATKMEFDLWTKTDVTKTRNWAKAEECRIPNKRVAKGGRLHKFINILLNNCEFISERLASEKRYQDACRDPTLPSGLDLKRQFVAPLAKRVLNKVEDEENEQAFKDDDPDSDDSEGRAM
ncbi:expressed unknown protein [Ectocarpus siliculosus]|uniref:Uncharacterized protein n=1 Tax=Ectocarpus siliculosus TaxID=2880 RepID=D8LLV1_ECTSI|nr:expressed unknown protein [Ectocarpus siliculosus]|eukprot:CBN77165.1 expressed unknown protein [Ectocarpus siliculosus]